MTATETQHWHISVNGAPSIRAALETWLAFVGGDVALTGFGGLPDPADATAMYSHGEAVADADTLVAATVAAVAAWPDAPASDAAERRVVLFPLNADGGLTGGCIVVGADGTVNDHRLTLSAETATTEDTDD